jgi:tetratricopeptide (TPR) repeat protein
VGRTFLFLLLVVAVPAGVYWAGNGGSFARLPEEIRELRGPEPAPPREPEPPPEPEPKPPEAEPEKPPPPAPPTPVTPAEDPRAKAQRLFREGRFADAARAYDGVDERRRAIALLGEAFTRAFPENLPNGPYVIIQTLTGERYEGFGEKEGGRLKIVDAAGRSFAFPESAISAKQEITREEARDRIAREALNSTEINGPRIFALIQAACTVGRPDAAAPLIEPALEADEKEPYFLSSVRGRVPAAGQKEMYRAFATAQAPAVMAADEPVVRVPARLGGGRNVVPQPSVEGGAKDPKVRALMEEAAPYRKRGEKLYKEIVLKGADASAKDLVDEAIREFDKALALYEKAVAIEESDALYSVMQSTSRLRFHVAFWKQQLEGR